MKKLSLVAILVLSLSIVYALDISGGVSYNSFNFDSYVDGEKSNVYEGYEGLTEGWGAQAGLGIGNRFGIEAGFEMFQSSGEKSGVSVEQKTYAPYGVLKLQIIDSSLPISFNINGGVGYYNNETTSSGELELGPIGIGADLGGVKYSGWGYLVGAGMRFNLNSNVGISINGSYRKAELPLTEMRALDGEYQKYDGEEEVKLDLSGFKVGANVVLSF